MNVQVTILFFVHALSLELAGERRLDALAINNECLYIFTVWTLLLSFMLHKLEIFMFHNF